MMRFIVTLGCVFSLAKIIVKTLKMSSKNRGYIPFTRTKYMALTVMTVPGMTPIC
jgi:hypothetical protein